MQPTFSENDHARIEESVSRAESRTSGEIVPFLMSSSDGYTITRWRSSLLMLAVGMVIVFTLKNFYQGWSLGWLYAGWGVALAGIVFVVIGLILVETIPAYKRWIAGPTLMCRMVFLSAMQAFVEEEVFKTRDRTGILVFMSLFERRVEVIGDEGINSVVEEGEWTQVVDLIIDGFKSGEVTNGIVAGITACGELLEKHGIEIAPGDDDELSNRLRVRER